jgi:hypothetical protein
MVRLILDKSRTPMMIAPNLRVETWQPWLSKENPLQTSHSSPTHPSTLASWQKIVKRKVKPKASSSPKYVSSDEDTISSDEDIASSDDDEYLPDEFCKNPNAMIKVLMKQVRIRDELLEEQEKLLVHERKSNA